MARYLLVLFLLIPYIAFAAPAGGGGGVGNPAGIRIQQTGVIKGDTNVLDLPSVNYSCTPFPVMTCPLSNNVTIGGSCIGDSPLDTCSPFDLTNKQIIISSTLTPVLSVQQQTIGTLVWQITTNATNDDPTENTYQNRAATTDATQTTLHTLTIPASTTLAVEARVIARRTGGSAGTAEDGAYYILNAVYKNVAGTATIIGSVGQTIVGESQAGFDATLTTSTNTVLVRVTGVANNNLTWHVTLRTWQVGS